MKNEPVAVIRCEDYEPAAVKTALKTLLESIDGLSEIRAGMRVGLKANLVAAMKPETAAATHPNVLTALTELLIERGASVVIGDSPGGPWMAAYLNPVYAATGMRPCEAAGAELNHDFSERDVSFPEGKVAKSFRYTSWLMDCDAIINVSKLKSHGMMGMSNAVKNLFGTVPGTVKPEYHFRYPNPNDFADAILDIGAFTKPVLHITDAIVAMEGNGPTQGKPHPMHALLASKNPHLLDWAAATMIGMDVDDIPTLQAAKRRGYLPDAFADVAVIGDFAPLCVSDFAVLKNRNSTLFSNDDKPLGRLRRNVLHFALGSRPQVAKDACIGCEKCARICPAHAIEMKDRLPVIHRRKCIECFCCQEFCPKGAMRVHRAAIARLFSR